MHEHSKTDVRDTESMIKESEPVAAHSRPPQAGSSRQSKSLPREIGGRAGPEPTRFGDWEKGGRCIDF
jgi:hypothetical protein